MGCWSSDGYHREKANLLLLAMIILKIQEMLMDFYDQDKVDQEKLSKVLKSIARLLVILGSEHSAKFKKMVRGNSVSSWCFKDAEGRSHQIHYEYFVVFNGLVINMPKKKRAEYLEGVRSQLLSVANGRSSLATRRKNAKGCMEFLHKFNDRLLYEFWCYTETMPKGILKLLAKGRL